MYVEDDAGNRIVCPHPEETSTVFHVLGKHASPEKIRVRTGFNSYCVCLSCKEQFELDLGDEEQSESSWRFFYGATARKDKRMCPHCASQDVKTVIELVGNPCPECKEGVIEEIETGLMC